MSALTNPASQFATITPSDTVLSQEFRSLYVGVSGDIAVKNMLGTVVVFPSVPVGVLPIVASQVMATGTTASGLIGLY